MAALILPEQTRLDACTELTSAGGILAGVVVALFKVDVTPTDKTVLADVYGPDETCDFDGYDQSSAVVWGPDVFYDPTGLASIYGDVKSFQSAPDQTKPQTIFGYALVIPGAEYTLRGVQRFDNPIPITDYPDGVPVLPRFDFGQ